MKNTEINEEIVNLKFDKLDEIKVKIENVKKKEANKKMFAMQVIQAVQTIRIIHL